MQEKQLNDKLTGLLWGDSIRKEIEKYLMEHPDSTGVLYAIDMDNFKQINERLGNYFADEVLKDIALCIQKNFRKDDLIGRIKGDQFFVFQKNISDVQSIRDRAKKLSHKIREIYTGENQSNRLSASIGIALYPEHADTVEAFMECADIALGLAKKSGRNQIEIYTPNQTESRGCIFHNAKQENKTKEISCIDSFGCEIVELSLRLMEDMRDLDSVINLLIRKVAAHYRLDVIQIRELVQKPRTMRYTYEYVKSADIPLRLDYELQYSEDEWNIFEHHFKNGYYLSDRSRDGALDIACVENEMLPSRIFLEIPIYNKEKIVGCIDYITFFEEAELSENDINVIKIFTKILSMYLLSMRDSFDKGTRVEELNEYDTLTGLMKYEVFHKKLQKAIDCGKDDRNIAIIYSDIKHFKYINETYGYDVGNRLLKRFSERMSKDIRGLIASARVYSDNVVMCAYVPKYCEDSLIYQEVLKFNNSTNQELQEAFMDSNITVCNGVFLIKNKQIDAETAVSNANMARKEAKKLERNTVVLFDDKMMEKVVRQMQLNAELPAALRNREIKVYYQPKIESGTGKIVGGEALVRWQKADGTFIYPDEFIPGFEENGLIVDVDYYVYDCVFAYVRKRIDENLPVVPISMNISSVHLKDDHFLPYVKVLFQRYQIPPKYVEFELTESIYIENLEQALPLIQSLRDLGIKISMDDFGSGYSSLNVLNNLPIDVLKLDKIFINREELTMNQKIIISCIVEMASKLDIKVVCEGVENQEQANFLTIIGCDMIQGYYYGKPMPEKDFDEYINSHLKVQFKMVHFPLNGNLLDTTGKYRGFYIDYSGKELAFDEGPFVDSLAFRAIGGSTTQNVIDVLGDVCVNNSFAISCWAKVKELSMWSSMIYLEFENGFSSLMANAGDLRSDFRMKITTEDDSIWHDTGSSIAPDEEWHFYAATYNALTGVGILYQDDQIAGYMDEVKSLKDAKRILIGGDIFTKSFHGWISEVKIYNQSLSKNDVISVFEEGKKRLRPDIKIGKIYI